MIWHAYTTYGSQKKGVSPLGRIWCESLPVWLSKQKRVVKQSLSKTPLVRASIDIINKYTWLLIVFFLGLLYFLSGQGIPIKTSSAMLTGLPAGQRVALKGTTDPAANGFPSFLVPKQEIFRPEASDKSLDRLERVAHRVRRGDTFGKLLRRFGLSAEESHLWIRSIRKHFSPKRLHVGKIINLYFAQDDSNLQGENTEKRRKKHLKTLTIRWYRKKNQKHICSIKCIWPVLTWSTQV